MPARCGILCAGTHLTAPSAAHLINCFLPDSQQRGLSGKAYLPLSPPQRFHSILDLSYHSTSGKRCQEQTPVPSQNPFQAWASPKAGVIRAGPVRKFWGNWPRRILDGTGLPSCIAGKRPLPKDVVGRRLSPGRKGNQGDGPKRRMVSSAGLFRGRGELPRLAGENAPGRDLAGTLPLQARPRPGEGQGFSRTFRTKAEISSTARSTVSRPFSAVPARASPMVP